MSRAEREIREKSQQRIFFQSFDHVWQAIQLSIPYPLAVSDVNQGIIETDWIDISDGFQPFHGRLDRRPIQYKLRVLVVRGQYEGESAVRVTIVKPMRIKPNFLGETRSVESDGVEEMLIFYRIERELSIAETIRQEASKEKNQP
ncbi:MAG: hypothetical protein NZ480_06075 [Bdellovibrionaceae bacterium]|nr:hypothetical protein [Pseudobdellovibrionaceae bacterium]MDW8190579.1 hypothetical protein [Pseudobdellovibrionaceae bacterium]